MLASSPPLDPESSWERFLVALESDVGDIQGGTTKEGIHMGVMSGTLDLVQRSYAGTQIRDGMLGFDPQACPRTLDGLSFSMKFRGTPLQVTLADGRLALAAHPDGVEPADPRRRRRRGPRALPRRSLHVRARSGDVRRAPRARG